MGALIFRLRCAMLTQIAPYTDFDILEREIAYNVTSGLSDMLLEVQTTEVNMSPYDVGVFAYNNIAKLGQEQGVLQSVQFTTEFPFTRRAWANPVTLGVIVSHLVLGMYSGGERDEFTWAPFVPKKLQGEFERGFRDTMQADAP